MWGLKYHVKLSAPYSTNNRLSPSKFSSTAVCTISPYQPSLLFWSSFIYLDFSLNSYLISALV